MVEIFIAKGQKKKRMQIYSIPKNSQILCSVGGAKSPAY